MYFKPFNLTRPISANSVVIIQFILIIPFVETVCLLAFFFSSYSDSKDDQWAYYHSFKIQSVIEQNT